MTKKRPTHADKPTIHEAPLDLASTILYMHEGYDEAYAACRESGHSIEDATAAAKCAWRCLLPMLSSREAAQVFIGCVAHGQQRGYITAEESRSLLYAAQMALAVMRKAGVA